jgi:hypothetical protein
MRDRAGAISTIKKGALVDKTRNWGLIREPRCKTCPGD